MKVWWTLTVLTAVLVFGNVDADLRIFFELNQALEFFRNDSSPLAQKILYTFEHDCCALEVKCLPELRKPFIVIEGNHRKSRNVVGMRLAKMMNGRYLVHPAHCLQRLSGDLPKGTLFRRAFYILSMYALAIDVKFNLNLNRAVVINGYWWDMLTFALVQAFPQSEIPEATNEMFKFPEDLLKPDLVFFLNFPDNLYYMQVTTRSPQTWKPRVLKLYRQLEKQGSVIMQDLTSLYRPTIDAVYEYVLTNLSAHRDTWFDNKRGVNFDYQHN